MPGFGVGVVTGNRWHELRFIKVNARVFKHFIDRLDRFRGHHGGSADFIHLQQRRCVTGTERRDTRAQTLFVVTFVHRHNFVIRVGIVETLRQGINLFAQLPFHRMPERNRGDSHCVRRKSQTDCQTQSCVS
ncbi:hypothetical protein D3C71_1446900 [compost metagenome]